MYIWIYLFTISWKIYKEHRHYSIYSRFFFKTFDSCVYVTEVSFHWFLFKLRLLSRIALIERAKGHVLSATWFTSIPAEKKLAKFTRQIEDRFFADKSTYIKLRILWEKHILSIFKLSPRYLYRHLYWKIRL